MAPYITALYNHLTSYFHPSEELPTEQNTPHHVLHSEPNPVPHINQPQEHYPKSPHNIHQAITHINRASPIPLPPELLKPILHHANYDCLHFTSLSTQQINTISRSATGPPARACVTSPPLYPIPGSSSAAPDFLPPAVRIRSLHLKFTGRDQGWISDPDTTSWSWFEIGKITSPSQSDQIERGPVLAYNAIAGQKWQDFEIFWHVDPEECRGFVLPDQGTLLREWISGLRGGERVCVVPMARYGGWQCRVSKACVDVEVEVWY